MNKFRFLITSVLFMGAIAAVVVFISKQQNNVTLEVDSQNTSKMAVLTKDDFKAGNFSNPAAVLTPPDNKVRLKKGNYVVYYAGAEGYSNGQVEDIDLTSSGKKIDVTPSYSQERLDSMLSSEIQDIMSSIKRQIAGIGTYKIDSGSLYITGDWYGTTLTYNGNDYFNADSLRLVMKKDGGTWKLATSPPQIVLSAHDHPDIPKEVLDGVNAQDAPIPKKYTN